MNEHEDTIRTFLAIDLPKGILDQIGSLQYRLRSSLEGMIRWTKPDRMHLTVKFFGNLSGAKIKDASQILERQLKEIKPFSLKVETIGVFPSLSRPKVLWLGIANDDGKLAAVQSNIENELASNGFPREERPYRPHLTLGRMKTERRIEGLDRTIEEKKNFRAGEFEARGLSLYRSDLRPGGPAYTRLGYFPFSE
jgi:RNA 2',3'-cyclic 3'-phosphodiesterase